MVCTSRAVWIGRREVGETLVKVRPGAQAPLHTGADVYMASSFPSLSLRPFGCEVSALEHMASVEYVSLCG